MFPQDHPLKLLWTFVLLVCVPFIIICYILSIKKTIKDRRLVLMLQEDKKIRDLKMKRRHTGLSSEISGSKSKSPKVVKKGSMPKNMSQGSMPKNMSQGRMSAPQLKGMAKQKSTEGKLTAEVENKMRTSYCKIEKLGNDTSNKIEKLGNDTSNNALKSSFLRNEIAGSDCAQKRVCISGAVVGKCKLKESQGM